MAEPRKVLVLGSAPGRVLGSIEGLREAAAAADPKELHRRMSETPAIGAAARILAPRLERLRLPAPASVPVMQKDEVDT